MDENKDDSAVLVECKLWEVDLYANWIKVQVPVDVMKKGFHAGSVKIDFTGVQDSKKVLLNKD